MKPNVVDFAAWRARRLRVDPPRRIIPSAMPNPVAKSEPEQFWAVSRSRSRLLLWALFGAFAITFLAAWGDVLDRRIMIFGLLGMPIIGFILWASSGEDRGERPAYALDGLGLVVDPAGDAKRYLWDAMVGVELGEEGRILLSVRDQQASCTSCVTGIRALPLNPAFKAADGSLFGDRLLSEVRRRGIQVTASHLP
jgi:hypothetical protein